MDPARLPTLSCSAQRQFDWLAQLRRFRDLSASGRTLRLLALQGTNHQGVTKNQLGPDLQVLHTQTHTGRQAQLYTHTAHTQCKRQVGVWQRSRARVNIFLLSGFQANGRQREVNKASTGVCDRAVPMLYPKA